MTVTNIYEAKAKLSELIKRVMNGEKVVIAKAGKPVAILSPYKEEVNTRHPGGSWQGKVWIADDFDEVSEDLIHAFQGKE